MLVPNDVDCYYVLFTNKQESETRLEIEQSFDMMPGNITSNNTSVIKTTLAGDTQVHNASGRIDD